MSRKKKIGLAIILIIAIVIFAPFFSGGWFQYQYQNNIRYFNSINEVHITIKSYQRGWYHSTAVVDVEVPLASMNLILPFLDLTGNDKKVNFNLVQHIDHGLFFYPSADNFHRVCGLAVVYSHGSLTPESKKILQEIGLDDFHFNNNAYVSIFGNYLFDMRLDKIQFKNTHNPLDIKFSEIYLRSWFMPGQKHLQGKLHVKDIEMTMNDARLTIPGIAFSFDQRATDLFLWTGKFDLIMNDLSWYENNEKTFSLTGLHLLGDTQKSHGFIHLNRVIKIDKIELDNETMGPLDFQLNAGKLSAQAISDLFKTYQTITRQGELYKDQLKKKLLLILPKVIYPGSNLTVKKFVLETPYGQVQTNGTLNWPTSNPSSPDSLSDFVKEAPANFTVTVSVPLMNNLLALMAESPYLYPYSQEEKSKIIKLKSNVDADFILNKQLLLQLGEIKLIDDDTQATLLINSRDRGSSDYYLYRIKELFLAKEISSYVTYLLYFNYGSLIYNIDALDKIVEKHTRDARELMINILKNSLINGQIYQSDDQYTTIITRDNQEIKLNGKIFSY